jgi:erythromycin esterase
VDSMVMHAHRINHPLDLDLLAKKLSNKRVVMLGESTHGTSEFYSYRAALSEMLIRDHGFKFVAVEGDWPDATRLRRYIQRGEGSSARSVLSMINRWPLWMWANEEVISFAEMLRHYECPFYGLDVYSLYESISEVIRYLKKVNPFLARRAAARYDCLLKFEGHEVAYAQSLLAGARDCEAEVIANLEDLLHLRIEQEYDDGEQYFNAVQNARVVRAAEEYYRTMLEGGPRSWNARDRHMVDTLVQLLEHHGADSKCIVWAHNSHIGDYRATDMWGEGYVNLGGLARQRMGPDQVGLVGFGTYQGHVLASHAWGSREEVMTLPSAKSGSIEECSHRASTRLGAKAFFLDCNTRLKDTPLTDVIGHRAVGVVYRPDHENRTQYVPTILTERYDAYVHIDRTRAVHSLGGQNQRGLFPETWPVGH